MGACLFGLETEYAIGGVTIERTLVDPHTLQSMLFGEARRSLTYVPDSAGGLFLDNGARLYADCGAHPEFCTPECLDPWDAVRYVRAGDRILLELIQRVTAAHPSLADMWLLRSNVGFGKVPTTWGCHESYLCRARPTDVARLLIPHLVSRTVFTGAGGINPFALGPEFSISPRAYFFEKSMSGDSTAGRGVFHTRSEPLAAHFHRVHVICGESLCSDLALWLKVGTTALVLAVIDAGVTIGAALELRQPACALRSIAGDADLGVHVELAAGGRITALGLQRRYLALVAEHQQAPFMPPWAADVVRAWSDMLDRLERGDPSLDRVLDWAIKRSLYARLANRRGIEWSSLAAWSRAIAALDAHDAVHPPSLAPTMVERQWLEPDAPPWASTEETVRRAALSGLDSNRLNEVLALGSELRELDTKFGRVGPAGVFSMLDRPAGILDHRLPHSGSIDDAMRSPPATGRAHVRGTAIRRIARLPDYRADWFAIYQGHRRMLDLTDPFTDVERWIDLTTASDESSPAHSAASRA